MRIAHTADIHLGITRYGNDVGGRNSRITDFAETLRRFSRVALEHDVQYAVFAGDTFHTRRPGPLEIRTLIEAVTDLTKYGIQVIIGPGNHDGMGAIADPETHTLGWMAALELDHVSVFPVPTVARVGGELTVASLPYAHKRSIESSASIRDRTIAAGLVVEQTITEMAEIATQKAAGGPTLFVGHLSTIDARLGSEGGMQMGWDTVIDPAVLEPFDYAALGHIHIGQQVGQNAWYAGAPDLHDFSDFEREPSFLIVDIGEKHGIQTVLQVPTGARRIVKVELLESEGIWPDEVTAIPDGAIVRLDLHQTSPKLPPEVVRRYTGQLRDRGASWVTVNVVKPQVAQRGRADMGADDDVIAATERWLRLQSVDPAPVLTVATELVAPFRTE